MSLPGSRKLQNSIGTVPSQYLLGAPPRSHTQAPKPMEDYLNYGLGQAQKTFTMNGGGTMSMSPLSSQDNLVARFNKDLMNLGMKYASGGKVSMSAGTAKTIKDTLSHLQSKDRQQAVALLRSSREALDYPGVGRSVEDILGSNSDAGMKRLSDMLAQHTQMANGGAVAPPEEAMAGSPDPQALYMEYQQLLAQVQSGQIDEEQQALVLQRLAEIDEALEAMGIDVDEQEPQQEMPINAGAS